MVRFARTALLAIALSTSLTTFGHGSGGGPRLVKVLGVDEKERKVFIQMVQVDESSEPETVWYFDANSPDPSKPRLARSLQPEDPIEGTVGNPAFKRLFARLKPLDPWPMLQMDVATEVIGSDSTESCNPRHRVRATFSSNRKGAWGLLFPQTWTTTCTTYVEPRVAVVSVQKAYGIGTLLVYAFRGVPWEECYEQQRAVLIPEGGR